ncbi:hypothetical protein [Pontibacter pudoricolor]|uniref:hypothetical protein n=1 Tax=Pontibacter pudoricolor TaxID=2694930 RepID=UPI001391DB50|nr:hypothetical protein [Pontibacter pudoricolor]
MLRAFASNLKQTATDLLSFLRNPSDTPVPGIQVTGKLQVLLGVLVLDVLLTFGFMGLIHLVELLGWHKYDAHAVAEMMRSFPLWGALLLGIIIVPFAEELVFRAGLRFRRGYFTFLLFVLLLAAGIFAFNMMPLLWALGAAFVLGLLMIVYLMNAYAIGEFLERAWPGYMQPYFIV